MSTKRFAIDKKGNKIYIGNVVKFIIQLFLVEDMNYLSWSKEQYITLRDRNNKNKILEYITPSEVTKLWRA